MVRPVWHPARHSEADTSETLQSDVMRFMAILALCLVAIFALVQSLPLRPVEPLATPQTAPLSAQDGSASPDAPAPPASPPVAQPTPSLEVAALEPVVSRETPVATKAPNTAVTPPPPFSLGSTSPSPAVSEQTDVLVPESKPPGRPVRANNKQAKPAATRAQLRRVAVEAPNASSKPAPDAPTDVSKQVEQVEQVEHAGLLLRFSSDEALLALVAQRRVQVYAWVGASGWRLSSERGELRFASADTPKRFHSMTSDTVPRVITRALRLVAPAMDVNTATWGVVLPADIGRQLRQLANRHSSGTLTIQANGRVRLTATASGRS